MKIHHDIHNLPSFKNAVITIGSFDGLHIGHQKIINQLKELATVVDGESVIVTFHPHPRSIIYPNSDDLRLLTDLKEKLRLLRSAGADHVVVVPFSIEFSQQSPEEYVESFLLRTFKPRYIVIGYDHKFGLNRIGDFAFLKNYEVPGQLDIVKIEKQEVENIAISSSKIRKAIVDGDILTANKFLGHNYTLRGKVIHGKKIGTTIDFPTANLSIFEEKKLLPSEGVYAVIAHLEELNLKGMMHIGPNKERPEWTNIEVHLFDFGQNIYEEEMLVEIVDYVRENQEFESLDLLKLQLNQDKIRCSEILQLVKSEEKNSKALVNVAILNYNGLSYLESFLPYLCDSPEESYVVSVIDNNSSDESTNYLKEWHPEVHQINLKKNYGFAEGYNQGLKTINNKYTIFLNSDVKVTENWVEPLTALMETDPYIIACQPKILSLENPEMFEYAGAGGGYMDKLGYPFCRGRIMDHIEQDNGQYDEIQEVFWTSGAAMIIRTDLFKSLGGFDKDYFAHQEEIDFCWRAKNAGYKCMYQPESVVYHLGGGTLDYGNEKKIFLNFRNNLSTILKNEKGSKLLWLFPLRLILDGVAGFRFLLQGKWKSTLAIVKAHFAIYGSIGDIRRKRKRMNELIRATELIPNAKNGRMAISLIWKHFVLGKKTFKDL